MNNLLYGILTIIFSATGYYFSWRYWRKNNYKIAIALLVISGFALRVYVSTDLYLHCWDERYQALVSKNLIQHPLTPTLYDKPVQSFDYRDWTANHIWVHKQPLPLWTMATSMWLFGVNEFALRIPSILLTSIGIWLMFLIGKFFFNNKTGYLAALFYSINGLIIELTGGRTATDHIDIFFLFFVELAVVFSVVFVQKQKTIYNVLAGVSMGAAILCKWLPALIVVPVWLLIVADSGSFKTKTIFFQLVILLAACTIIFLPWQLYIFNAFPLEASWEAGSNFRHITNVLDGRAGPFYYFFDTIRINYGELIYLPLIWFIWKTFKDNKNKKRLAILIWFLVPVIFFSIAKTKMQAYILFAAPALFLMTSEFYFMLADYKINHKRKWLINIVLFLLIALPVRYSIERVKPFETIGRNPQWVMDLKKLNEKNISNGVLFNYDKPVEAMFYTGLTVYPNIPDKIEICDLLRRGYIIVINDNGKIPTEIKSINGVLTEKL